MITTFEKMLDEILRVGIASNAEFNDVDHPGIIGDMYEGLTKEVLQASILDGCKVRVCKGKIRNKAGDYSGQIDCMIAVGEGDRIPHTDHYIYNINDVIAVLEVKKSLDKAKLKDAIEHFDQLTKLRLKASFTDFTDDLAEVAARTKRDAFRAVFRRPFPRDESSVLPAPYTKADNAMYASICFGALFPLFIVWGYYGHHTESGFRTAIADSIGTGGIVDVIARPDGIFSGGFTYIKANGMPFAGEALYPHGRLHSYTQRGLVVRTLLNLIWYRLCMRFRRDFAILSDGHIFSFNPLASYYVDAAGEFCCVAYETSEKNLRTIQITPPAPTILSLEEMVIMLEASNGPVDISDPSRFFPHIMGLCNSAVELCASAQLKNPLRLTWSSFEEFLAKLTSSGFVVTDEGSLRSTTSRPQIIVTENGIFGFENRDGSFNALFPDGFLKYLYRHPGYDHQRINLWAFMQ